MSEAIFEAIAEATQRVGAVSMTDFVLTRDTLNQRVTLGELFIGRHHICWTCEDPEREVKVMHETCIPRGRYQIKRTFSNRFQHVMPLLLDVPGFDGIRIHPGNTVADTSGCILPGMVRRDNGVGESQLAYREVLKWLDAIDHQGHQAWIDIKGPEDTSTKGLA